MKKISAEIVADSISPQGHRITTMLLTYPRFIHSELMTHRMFSRNSASSRAIPFKKMVEMVKEDPFVPIAWQLDHKGMQGSQYADKILSEILIQQWIDSSKEVILRALLLNAAGATKQLCNRLLEPFMWHTTLVTATEWDNFFELRCPKYDIGDGSIHKSRKDAIRHMQNKGIDTEVGELFGVSDLDWIRSSKSDAEIHIQTLAESMWNALNESTPTQLVAGEWHIPFGDKMNDKAIEDVVCPPPFDYKAGLIAETKKKIAVARCARLSYMTHEGGINYDKDIELHDRLLSMHHMSPFEHVARCMSEIEYFFFIKGEYPTMEDQWGIINYELYPFVKKAMFEGDEIGVNKNNGNKYGWCNNFRGWIPYRYLVER